MTTNRKVYIVFLIRVVMGNNNERRPYNPKMIVTYVALAVAIGVTALFGDYNSGKRETEAIKDNKCRWEEVVAESGSSYWEYATNAIKESKDLGARVGVNRVAEILSEKNDEREMRSGESYDIYRCSNK